MKNSESVFLGMEEQIADLKQMIYTLQNTANSNSKEQHKKTNRTSQRMFSGRQSSLFSFRERNEDYHAEKARSSKLEDEIQRLTIVNEQLLRENVNLNNIQQQLQRRIN
jgi:hypothetical protein